MNAVAAVRGTARRVTPQAAGALLARMLARGAGRAVSVAAPFASLAASGTAPAHADRAGAAALVGDIRLANAGDLRASLGVGREPDDAALVLEAYVRRGLDFAEPLAGDFAFVILDRRERRLIAARDPLGIRPLHYRVDDGIVRIASDLAALVEPGDVVDEGYLAEALSGDVVDTHATPYAAVRRLPAAHLLIASEAGVRIQRYWEPSRDVASGSPDDHRERFRAAFDDAVRACCVGATRVGLHVSGGLDSSSVLGTVMAHRLAEAVAGGNLLPWPEADERDWIDAACARWGGTPMLARPASAPPAHDLASIASHRDLPDHPNGAPLFAPLHHAFRAEGLAVVLTGFGGDQWWSGESAHMADLARRGDVAALLAWRRGGAAMGDVAWTWRGFARNGLRPLVPRIARRAARALRPASAPPWLAPAFAARVHLVDRLRRRPDTRGAPSEAWRRLRWRLESGEEALAKERIDRMAVAHGVELRHPMYDRRLVALALATPDDARIAGGRNRVVLREAMRDRIAPAVYARRGKADLTPLLIAAARAADLDRHVRFPMLAARGWIEPHAAHAIVRRARETSDPDAAAPFWSLVGVEAWLREVFGAE